MINYGGGIAGYVLDVVSLTYGLFTSVASIMIIVILVYYQCHNRLKSSDKITLLLSINIYLLIFFNTMTVVSFNIKGLIGDVHGYDFQSSWCIFMGYFFCMVCCAFYHAFVLQVNNETERLVMHLSEI